MITKKTVIVVGAGASHDLGLPLGEELKKRVAFRLSDPEDRFSEIFIAAVHYLFDQDRNRAAQVIVRAKELSGPLASAWSIDNFLDQRKSETDFIAVAKNGNRK